MAPYGRHAAVFALFFYIQLYFFLVACDDEYFRTNMDRPGWDIKRIPSTSSAEDCVILCTQNKACKAWAFNRWNGDCWLKNPAPPERGGYWWSWMTSSGLRAKDAPVEGKKYVPGGEGEASVQIPNTLTIDAAVDVVASAAGLAAGDRLVVLVKPNASVPLQINEKDPQPPAPADRCNVNCLKCVECGLCVECKTGYYPPQCDPKCSRYCAVCREPGVCDSCQPGFNGSECRPICQNCVICASPNQCIKCLPGYAPPTCAPRCAKMCRVCGAPNLCLECLPGYSGPSCDPVCTGHCLTQKCVRPGVCAECEPGYFAPGCAEENMSLVSPATCSAFPLAIASNPCSNMMDDNIYSYVHTGEQGSYPAPPIHYVEIDLGVPTLVSAIVIENIRGAGVESRVLGCTLMIFDYYNTSGYQTVAAMAADAKWSKTLPLDRSQVLEDTSLMTMRFAVFNAGNAQVYGRYVRFVGSAPSAVISIAELKVIGPEVRECAPHCMRCDPNNGNCFVCKHGYRLTMRQNPPNINSPVPVRCAKRGLSFMSRGEQRTLSSGGSGEAEQKSGSEGEAAAAAADSTSSSNSSSPASGGSSSSPSSAATAGSSSSSPSSSSPPSSPSAGSNPGGSSGVSANNPNGVTADQKWTSNFASQDPGRDDGGSGASGGNDAGGKVAAGVDTTTGMPITATAPDPKPGTTTLMDAGSPPAGPGFV